MKSRWRLLITIVSLVIGGSCLLACLALGGLVFFGPTLYEGMLASSSLQVGETAPDFELRTLTGETLRLSDFRGQPVLLTIGASWCPDCRREAPLLQALHEESPSLIILMVDIQEDLPTVQAYADQYRLTFPIALDYDGAIAQTYRVWAIPTELLIDEKGVIRARIIEQVTEEKLAVLLAEVGIEP